MPKLQADYSKNIIYKLCSLDQSITDIYIGQTTNFTKRKNSHKSKCNKSTTKDYNRYVYQFIREHGGWDNWSMIQIEEYPCINKREAESRETYWMKELKSTLNSIQSFMTEEEKKERIQKYQITDTFKENQEKYRATDKHKETLKKWVDENKEYIKQTAYLYRQNNKEHKSKIDKEYRANNKEKIKEYKEKHKEEAKIWNREYGIKKRLYLNELKCYNID